MPAPFPPSAGPLLLLAPHPDDETIGAGGLLSQACAAGMEVWVAVVTAGDAFRWSPGHLCRAPAAQLALGERRLQELRLAAQRLGLRAGQVLALGFPDQGLSALLEDHWDRPYRSVTGAEAVPYPGALAPGTPYSGRALRELLLKLIERVRPAWVLVPGPLDHHADHRALTRLAQQLVEPARLLYYPVEGTLLWPFPKGLHPDWLLAAPPAYGDLPWQRVALNKRALAAKAAALSAYRSQLGPLAPALHAYLRRNELLLPATALVRA